MEDYKIRPQWPGVPIHLQVSLGGTIHYAAGAWGEAMPVGEGLRVEITRHDVRGRFKPFWLASAETNDIGDFMLIVNAMFVRVGRDFIYLTVFEKGLKRNSPFNITNLVNWNLTTQSQLLAPFAVHWGPIPEKKVYGPEN